MEAGAGRAQALGGPGALVPSPPHARWGHRGCCSPIEPGAHGQPQQQPARGAERDPPAGGPGQGRGSGAIHTPSHLSGTSMGAGAAEAKHRFPIKRVYLAPALLTLKQEGLKVNSLSIPYCQLIHHPGRAGAARALPAPVSMGLGGQPKDAVAHLCPI